MNLLELNTARRYIGIASKTAITKLQSHEFSVLLRENVEFLI